MSKPKFRRLKQKIDKFKMRQNNVKFGEKDVRQRLIEALRRYGYKQVDVSKETGKKLTIRIKKESIIQA